MVHLEDAAAALPAVMSTHRLPRFAFVTDGVLDVRTLDDWFLPSFHPAWVSEDAAEVGEQLNQVQPIAGGEEVDAVHLEGNA